MNRFLFLLCAITGIQASNFSLWAQSPTVVINQQSGQPDPTSNAPISFTATFSTEMNGFEDLDISFTGTTVSGNVKAFVSGGPTQYTISVTGMTSSGKIVVSIPAGVASSISSSTPNLASTSTDNEVTFIQPSITCPGNVTVSTDNGTCSAIVNNITPVFSPANADLSYKIYSPTTVEEGGGSASGKSFPVGMSTVFYTLPQYPGISCSFTVIVRDLEPPVINCPANITVSCTKDVPLPGGVYATDACSPSNLIEIKFVGQTISNQTCPDKYTLTRTYKATDYAGNSSTCIQQIFVYDDKGLYFIQPPPVSPLNVSCPSEVPIAYPNGFTAIDECYPDDIDILVDFKEVKTPGACPTQYSLTRTWTATDPCGNKTVYTQIINVNDKKAPEFNTPAPSPSILVSCASDIPKAQELTATDNCSGGTATVTLSEVKSEEVCANKFKLTRTWTATDACGNTAVVTQVINVDDKQAPVFNGLPPTSSILVSCAKDIPPAAAQTATDNCGGTPVITYSEVKSNVQCANRFTLTRTWTATDECGNSATRTQIINVYDNEAPKLTGISADPTVLWPPNHKMRDVTINYTASDNCAVTSSLSVTSSDPVHGGSDGDQSPDWEIIDAHHVRLRAEKSNNGQARHYTITITATDSCNTPVVATVTVVVAHNITGPLAGNPFKIGSVVSMNGVFWDKPGNNHTAKWLLDGTAAANGVVTEPTGNQNGKVSGSYKFNTAGVYKLQMNVTDQTGLTSWVNTNNDLDAIVVIYDPNGGNAYGGGWFHSQPGAIAANPDAEGKASYGFAVNYRNAAKPKGETQFEFKVGSFEFNALNFDYLSIDGARAQFRGTGKIIGGQSGIGFIMTVTDGDLDGSGVDKIRMKIYNRNTGYIYYDNQPGASEAADPSTGVGANSSIVIQGNAAAGISTNQVVVEPEKPEARAREMANPKLELLAYPNPSSNYFSVQVKSNDFTNKMLMQVFDQYGRLLEKNENIKAGSVVRLGEFYRPGIYYVRIVQGGQHSEIKLVRLSD